MAQCAQRASARLDGCPEIWRVSHAVRGSAPLPAAYSRQHQRRRLAVVAEAVPSPPGQSVVQLKQHLLLAVSRSNNPQPKDNLLQLEQQVEEAAEQLAAANPTPDAALSPLLLGSWALLYSGRSRRLAAAAGMPSAAAAARPSLQQALQVASDRLYSSFYTYLPLLAGSAVGRSRGGGAANLQVLHPGRVDNVVSTRGALPLRLCVSGSVEAVSPSCVAVRFDSFTVRAGALPEAALSLTWLRPLGYVDTLYLDGELRVSVGDKGGLFILSRAGESELAERQGVAKRA